LQGKYIAEAGKNPFYIVDIPSPDAASSYYYVSYFLFPLFAPLFSVKKCVASKY
jgi:hypothetical protein